MTQLEIMEQRHSVRKFLDKPLDESTISALQAEIDACNEEGGLRIQLVTNEPEAFQAGKPSYGQFKCCKNYLALVAKKGKDEEIGYYGERVVLKAQEIGLNSCWVALTFKKGKAKYQVAAGEKLYLVVALGYGESAGSPHKVKNLSEVSNYKEGDPDWYKDGLEAVLLAPTAMNQQKFKFVRDGEKVTAKSGFGVCAKIDLGIAKYHFETAAGKGKAVWG